MKKSAEKVFRVVAVSTALFCAGVTSAEPIRVTDDIDWSTSVRSDESRRGQDEYWIEVPTGSRAEVTVTRSSITTAHCAGTMRVDVGDSIMQPIDRDDRSVSKTCRAGTTAIVVESFVGTVEQYEKFMGYVGPPGGQVATFRWTDWETYSCTARYKITVKYVQELPDLLVTSLSITPDEIMLVDANAAVDFTIGNSGAKDAGAFKAGLYVDGTRKQSFDVSGLHVGGVFSRKVSFGQLSAGSHEVAVKVDEGGAVAESSEDNNRRSMTVTVCKRTPYKVHFLANGGAGTMKDQDFVLGTASDLRPNAFTREGFRFAGWALSATGEKKFSDGHRAHFVFC